MANPIQQYNIGTVFTVTITDEDGVVDVSSANVKHLIFRKPDESKLTKNASFYTDGTDGIIKYPSASGDLDQVGFWKLQGYVELGSNQFYSEIAQFKVNDNL